MHVGMTGTRKGMTDDQKYWLRAILEIMCTFSENAEMVFHHGDAVGADAEGHAIARSLGYTIEIHPPEDTRHRAFCDGDIVHSEKPYLDRNKDIVDACVQIIGIPDTEVEVLRSGTWSTLRYARSTETGFIIVNPNGIMKASF